MDRNDHDRQVGVEVSLPPLVDELVEHILAKHNLPPLTAEDRRRLAADEEQEALRILRTIASTTAPVRNFPAYISHLRNQPPPPSPALWSPSGRSSLSSPPSKIRRISTAQYFATPPAETKTVDRVLFPEDSAMEALGELEFRKQFLILNYVSGKDLQNVISAEKIRSLKELEMVQFEEQLWQSIGRRFVDPKDRVKYGDWDTLRTHVYHCHVSQEGSYRFKGPFLEKTRTHLQKVLEDDNVLMVKFAGGETSHDHFEARYSEIAKEGISVGLRVYRFFVFKDGGKEEKKKSPYSSPVKCYFVRTQSNASIDQNKSYILSNKTISEARQLFMHGHTVSSVHKYMARFQLILSKTYSLKIDLSSVKVDFIEDVYCLDESGNRIYRDGKALIHTDGTGFISEDLALLCPKNSFKGQHINNENIETFNDPDELEDNIAEMEQLGSETGEPPILIQCRMFYNGYAVKGTFLVNKKLEPRTIQIRESMVKVFPDPNLSNYTKNSLEIVTTSNAPKTPTLSRNLIALLSHGGVPDKFFTDLLSKAFKEGRGKFSNKRAAFKVAMKHGSMDSDFTAARMIACGIPLEESFLQYRLSVLVKEESMSLALGKLHVPDCFYLMGTTDPTGKLKSDEVCIVIDNGRQVSGKVLVYRNPGLHFGDIHVLKATYIEELESFIGTAKYAIFFPQKGARSVADEIAGGDFDGDTYWVSRNSELLKHFQPSEPWIQKPSTGKIESKRPSDFTAEELEDELIKLFLTTRFQPSFAVREAANNWLALMDRFLTLGDDNVDEKNALREKLIKLIDIYYVALDAPKEGAKIEVPRELRPEKFPHYMKRENSFKSESILGKIHDDMDAYMAEDHSKEEIRKLPCFDVDIPEDCWNTWKKYYEEYRGQMSKALNSKDDSNVKNKAADNVKRKYKMLLYGAEELEESTKDMDDIYNEALAIYNLSYKYAIDRNDVRRCSFAWNIAGSALIKLYASKENGAGAFIFSPSVLKKLLE